VAEGRFREDLVYRLNVVHIEVPPLRERRSDIPALIAYLCTRAGKSLKFSVEAQRALQVYHWPGNVRELNNAIERLVWTVSGECQVADLPRAVRMSAGAPPSVTPARERRRQTADHLYDGLVTGQYNFWTHVHPLFLQRDITRHDLRTLVRRGLNTTCGNYRALLTLFGMPQDDYKKFLNFLAAHDCRVDFRSFRERTPVDGVPAAPIAALLPAELRAG
jgi:DNA-binding NtrC family response regulator